MTPHIFPEKLKRKNDSVMAEYIGKRAQEKTSFFCIFCIILVFIIRHLISVH